MASVVSEFIKTIRETVTAAVKSGRVRLSVTDAIASAFFPADIVCPKIPIRQPLRASTSPGTRLLLAEAGDPCSSQPAAVIGTFLE